MLIPYDLQYQPFTIRTAMFAKELARRGHNVQIFYREITESERWKKIKIHASFPDGCEVSVRPRMSRPSSWRYMSDVIRKADVVHFQKSNIGGSLIALVLGRRFGKAIHQDWDDSEFAYWWQEVGDAWSSDEPLSARTRKILRALPAAVIKGSIEWLVPKVVDTLGGASMFLRKKSIELGCDPSSVFPAPVGVDAGIFHPSRRDVELRQRLGLKGPTVLFAGTFDVYPDLVFFVEALRELLHEAPEAQCLVVGGGPARSRLVELLPKGLPAHSVVMTEGFVPFADMPRYVASADIAALPFRDTPVYRSKSSLTLLESMASGLPCVTHDVGDIGWMLGDGGEIAPLGDPKAFGRILAELARSPARRQQLGAKARARAVERFSWGKSVDYLEAAYRRGVAKRNGAPLPRETGIPI